MTQRIETPIPKTALTFPGTEQPAADTSEWSARHLPAPETPRSLRFAVVAVAASLVAIILGTALSGPIDTRGTKMEPGRFSASVQQGKDTIRASTVRAPITVASVQPHR